MRDSQHRQDTPFDAVRMHHAAFNGTPRTAAESCQTHNAPRRTGLRPHQHFHTTRANPRPQGHTMPSPSRQHELLFAAANQQTGIPPHLYNERSTAQHRHTSVSSRPPPNAGFQGSAAVAVASK